MIIVSAITPRAAQSDCPTFCAGVGLASVDGGTININAVVFGSSANASTGYGKRPASSGDCCVIQMNTGVEINTAPTGACQSHIPAANTISGIQYGAVSVNTMVIGPCAVPTAKAGYVNCTATGRDPGVPVAVVTIQVDAIITFTAVPTSTGQLHVTTDCAV